MIKEFARDKMATGKLNRNVVFFERNNRSDKKSEFLVFQRLERDHLEVMEVETTMDAGGGSKEPPFQKCVHA